MRARVGSDSETKDPFGAMLYATELLRRGTESAEMNVFLRRRIALAQRRGPRLVTFGPSENRSKYNGVPFREAVFTRDGSALAVFDQPTRIELVDCNREASLPGAQPSRGNHDGDVYSPDGKSLVAASGESLWVTHSSGQAA